MGAGLILLALLSYVCLSLRLGSSDSLTVVETCRFPSHPPAILPAGWHFSPLWACSATSFPTAVQVLPYSFPEPGTAPLVSSEGVASVVRGELAFRIPPSSAPRLSAAAPGEHIAVLLRALLRHEVGEAIRPASFARVSGAHRVELESVLAPKVGAKLRNLGLILVSLRVDSVRMAQPGSAFAQEPLPDSKLLVIGLDGADWRIIDPLLRRGKMPTLARLVHAGVRARLRSIDPILSPVVWTTAATGFLPTRHGILDFLVTDTRTGGKVPVTSRHRNVKAVWNLLSDSGVRVGVIGWWATWPAEFVDGFIVSDRVAYQLFGQAVSASGPRIGKTFPPELYEKIQPLIVSPERIDSKELKKYLRYPLPADSSSRHGASREEELKTVLASTATYENISMALESNKNQFEAIYFEGIDTISHLFMPFRPPMRPGVDIHEYEAYSGAVDAFYETQDQIMGEILAKIGPDTGVIVLSDHGFKSENDRPLRESRINYATAASWHRKYGVFVASGGRFRDAAELSEVSVMDVTPTILTYFGLPVGEDMDGRPVTQLFRADFLRAHPVTYRPSWESAAGAAPRVEAASDPEGDKALKEKLLALGYLSRDGALSSNNLGNALLSEGKVDEAIESLRAAVVRTPGFSMPKINLARAYLRKQDVAAARREIDEVLKTDPASPEAALLMAEIEIEEGAAGAARKRLEDLLRRDASLAEAHRLLGEIYIGQGDGKRAELELRHAIEIDSDNAESHNALGVLYRQGGRMEDARAEFQKAIEADPSSYAGYSNLATLSMDQENWEEAGRLLDTAIRLAPKDAATANNRGNLYLHQGNLEAAAQEFRRAILLAPRYSEPHNGLGAVALRQGREEEAVAEFRKAIELDPKNSNPRINLARQFLKKGDSRLARRELEAYLQEAPGETHATLELASLLLREGMAEEAARLCTASLAENPAAFQIWNLRGDALRKLGKSSGAAESYRHSLELNPYQPEIAAQLHSQGGSP